MPRPQKRRRICALPRVRHFAPSDVSVCGVVAMTIDEYETIRLMDLLGCTQEECAAQMGVARTTVQAVYGTARRKLAEALVKGKQRKLAAGRTCSARRRMCAAAKTARRSPVAGRLPLRLPQRFLIERPRDAN